MSKLDSDLPARSSSSRSRTDALLCTLLPLVPHVILLSLDPLVTLFPLVVVLLVILLPLVSVTLLPLVPLVTLFPLVPLVNGDTLAASCAFSDTLYANTLASFTVASSANTHTGCLPKT